MLSEEDQAQFEELSALFYIGGNYPNYRKAVRLASPPGVPYLRMLLADLTEAEQTLEDQIEGLIHFEKRTRLAKPLLQVQRFQTLPFPFLPDVKVLTDLLSVQSLNPQFTVQLAEFDLWHLEPEDPEKEVEQLLLTETL